MTYFFKKRILILKCISKLSLKILIFLFNFRKKQYFFLRRGVKTKVKNKNRI